jgi:hypothetical protein
MGGSVTEPGWWQSMAIGRVREETGEDVKRIQASEKEETEMVRGLRGE